MHICTYMHRYIELERLVKYPPKYAAWLVDSASPSLRRSFPASPGVEQWAGELSNMKFLLLEVLIIRGGRSTLITVCSNSWTSGCSSQGLSEGQSLEERSRGKSHKVDFPHQIQQNSALSSSKLEHPGNQVFPKFSFS